MCIRDSYYAEERAIPLELEEVWRMVRAIEPEERRAVQKVLDSFFSNGEDGWHQKRVDHEIEVSQTARDNGGKGGRPRTGNGTGIETGHETGLVTGIETGSTPGNGTGEAPGMRHPPSSNHQPKNMQPPEGVSDGLWREFRQHRGRKF